MRQTTILAVLLGLLVSFTAAADTLMLVNGGKLDGTVEKATFLTEGREISCVRSEIKALSLSETTDTLELTSGSKVKGELISEFVKESKICPKKSKMTT